MAARLAPLRVAEEAAEGLQALDQDFAAVDSVGPVRVAESCTARVTTSPRPTRGARCATCSTRSIPNSDVQRSPGLGGRTCASDSASHAPIRAQFSRAAPRSRPRRGTPYWRAAAATSPRSLHPRSQLTPTGSGRFCQSSATGQNLRPEPARISHYFATPTGIEPVLPT